MNEADMIEAMDVMDMECESESDESICCAMWIAVSILRIVVPSDDISGGSDEECVSSAVSSMLLSIRLEVQSRFARILASNCVIAMVASNKVLQS
mmetsp:Transcript_7734/g.12308  ORF Transcript_7734/g.12308 Transcript_7734/m.12308 type:complete len:95 (-) Transcript_7734:2-286(-)